MSIRRSLTYQNYVLLLIGVALLVGCVLFCVTAVNIFWPKKSADVSKAITALQDDIKKANDAHPCTPIEYATLEITVDATTTHKLTDNAGTDNAGASFKTTAENIGENSNRLTLELVNKDPRVPSISCEGWQK